MEVNFKTIVDTVYVKKSQYTYLTNEDKEKFFFIFNRYMSKKYPIQAQFFNKPNIDKASAMDIWFQFLSKEIRVPFWFWRGKTKKTTPKTKDWKILQEYYNGELSVDDILLLEEFDINAMKDELKRIKKINKEMQK